MQAMMMDCRECGTHTHYDGGGVCSRCIARRLLRDAEFRVNGRVNCRVRQLIDGNGAVIFDAEEEKRRAKR